MNDDARRSPETGAAYGKISGTARCANTERSLTHTDRIDRSEGSVQTTSQDADDDSGASLIVLIMAALANRVKRR